MADEVEVAVTTGTADNSAPIASPFPDQEVEVGTSVQFDGRGSSDGDQLTYAWTD